MKPAKLPVRRQTKQPASATVEEQSAEKEAEAEADQLPPTKNAAPSSTGTSGAEEDVEEGWEKARETSIDIAEVVEPVRKKRKKKRKTVVKKWDPMMPLPTRREPDDDDPSPAPVKTTSGRLVKRTNFLNIG